MSGLAPGTRAILGGTPAALRTLLDEDWSVADVIAHLVVIDRRGLRERIEGMLANDDPDGAEVLDVNETASLAASGLRGRPATELLQTFEAQRAGTLAWLDGLSEAELARPGLHELVGAITAADVVHHMAYHDALHLAQVARMLARPVDAARGNMQQLG